MIKRQLFPIIFIVLIISSLAGYVWFSKNVLPVSDSKEKKEFLITKGSGVIKIANNLQKERLIKSALVFKIYTKITATEGRIQAGQYELSPSMSMLQIIGELLNGPREVWVTIPEGLRKEEIAEKFIEGFGLKDDKAQNFRSEFLALSKDREGYLFPDTYLFPKTTPSSTVVSVMTSTFNKKTAGLDISQRALIIASLLERETITDEEKPVVAGIILKRLNASWPLQIDAAVQYAVANSKLRTENSRLNNYWETLIKDDLDIVSPYNTYAHPGLPPSLIASPGLSSIKAAIDADLDTPYWYYIHDAKGLIYYAVTLSDHNENIRKYLGK